MPKSLMIIVSKKKFQDMFMVVQSKAKVLVLKLKI